MINFASSWLESIMYLHLTFLQYSDYPGISDLGWILVMKVSSLLTFYSILKVKNCIPNTFQDSFRKIWSEVK